jgi:hypothetical protein
MADCAIQQAQQSCSGGQSKRTDEIVGINIEQLFIVHHQSFHHFETPCA